MTIFQQISHDRSADEVAHQIEGLILEGVLRPGDQLPGERELAAEMGVSRPVVREAIETLVAGGILHRRQGDGTFVGDIIGQVFSDPIAALLPHHRKATHDYLEYRREVEGIAAGLAAERATGYDRDMLQQCVERMKSAHERQDFAEEAKVDLEFHSLIGEMAHNLVLLHTLRSCYKLLSEGIFQNRSRLYEKPGARQALYDQHMAIADAILAGNREAAGQAARDHMSYVMEKSLEMDNEAERERISGLRFRKRER
ncbi:MAG: FCD domain-containing protein [Notoacmeibacter sp.]|nr:FCD domain-containing protein [Notoacmeibacter sp.]MCB1421603.1 FCD domain-containing protein [Nitratireductor sp.]